MKWIVIVTFGWHKSYDCILEQKLYETEEDAQKAIKEALKEDKESESSYTYRTICLT